MKRLIYLVLSLFVFFSAGVTALAAECETYYIREMGMKIDIPEEFVVFTRDNVPTDSELAIWGWTLDEIRAYLKTNNLYLQAVNQDLSYEISISMVEKPLGYLNHFSENEISSALQSRKDLYTSSGDEWLGASVHHHQQTKFLKTDLKRFASGATVYAKEYFTIYEDKTISINLYSYVGEFDPSLDLKLEQIIDSVRFDSKPEYSLSREYCDEESGAVFQIPEGWRLIPHNTDFEGTQFCPMFVPHVFFLLTCTDIYSEYLEYYAERNTTPPFETRAEFDRIYSTRESACDTFNCEADDVQTVEYGDVVYYYTKSQRTLEQNGTPVVYLTRIENGYMYFFQYYGDKENTCYPGVEQMLAGAVYPTAEEESTTQTDSSDLFAPFHPSNLIFSLILTIAIYSLPIFIYRWCIRRYPVEKKKAKIIAIVYGIVSWIAMSAILFAIGEKDAAGGAVFLWGCINYYVLIGGKDRRKAKNDLRGTAQDEDPWTKSDRLGPGGEED